MQANYYQFLVKHFPHRYIRDTLGCRASWRVHQTSNDHINANGGVALFKPNFGRPATPDAVKQRIKQFLIPYSRLSANQTTSKDPSNPYSSSPMRILDDSVSNLFIDYRIASPLNRVCESVFTKTVKELKIFCNANHSTDLCGYCLRLIQLKPLLTRLENMYQDYEIQRVLAGEYGNDDEKKMFVDDNEYLGDDETWDFHGRTRIKDGSDIGKYGYDLTELLTFVWDSNVFESDDKKLWDDRIWDYVFIINHRCDKNATNAKHKQDIDSPPPNTIVITIDFKQNMVIGRQKTERNALFKRRSARTVFGVYVVCQSGRFYVDYLSDCISHTATFAVSCVKHLFDQEWLKNMVRENNIQHVKYWSDKGPHFVTCHNLYFWLVDIMYNYEWVSSSTVNFFIAKHGKNYLDGHFGLLNYYFSIFVKTDDAGVHDTDQLANALITGHEKTQRRYEWMNNNVNHSVLAQDINATNMRCVNFDLNTDNRHTRQLLNSKEDKEHIQYMLIWKGKIQSFNCYKAIRSEITETDRNNYNAFKQDSKYHKVIGYGPTGPVYTLKTRFDFNKTYKQLSKELNKARYRESTPYKHGVYVASMPFKSYPLEFKRVEFNLGISIIPKTKQTKKYVPLDSIKTDVLYTRTKHRRDFYRE